MPQIYNRHHKNAPPGAIYCGRGTPWGNMFTTLEGLVGTIWVETRDEACDRFDAYVEANPAFKQKIKYELCGKDLVCSCVPRRCHCETLLRVANE